MSSGFRGAVRMRLSAALLGLLLMAGWLLAVPAYALDMMSAINKAGRQRMLTQRMAKAYCQIGLDVRRDEAQAQLDAAIRQFDSQLAELRRFAPTAPVAESLATVDALWGPYRKVMTAPFSRDGAAEVMALSEDLLTATHRTVVLLEGVSGKSGAHLVNLAGRQRMLSQRIAKFYMLRELGFRQPLVTDGLSQVRDEFVHAQEELRAAPQNNDDTRKLLEYVDIQWQLLDYSTRRGEAALAEFVALSTDKILNAADVVTAKYESLNGAP